MATPTNGAQSTDDKKTVKFTVSFHKDNARALETMASAYGVNDEAIGKPLSVPLWFKSVLLAHIAATHEKRGFNVAKESELDTRNNIALPEWARQLPEDTQDKLKAMKAPERKNALDLILAESMRQMQSSVLAAVAAKMAEPKS